MHLPLWWTCDKKKNQCKWFDTQVTMTPLGFFSNTKFALSPNLKRMIKQNMHIRCVVNYPPPILLDLGQDNMHFITDLILILTGHEKRCFESGFFIVYGVLCVFLIILTRTLLTCFGTDSYFFFLCVRVRKSDFFLAASTEATYSIYVKIA